MFSSYFVDSYIGSSRNIKFIDVLDMNKVREYENQYNVKEDQEFYFTYKNTYRLDNSEEYYTDDEKDMYNFESENEYDYISSSSEDELEYY